MRGSSCSLLVENMLANCFRIAAFMCKDAPPIGQLHGRHPVWGLQQIVQHRRGGRSPNATSRERNRGQLRGLLARNADLDAPTEHHARHDAMAAADLRHTLPGCSDSNTMASFSSSVKLRRFERWSRGGSASRAVGVPEATLRTRFA